MGLRCFWISSQTNFLLFFSAVDVLEPVGCENWFGGQGLCIFFQVDVNGSLAGFTLMGT